MPAQRRPSTGYTTLTYAGSSRSRVPRPSTSRPRTGASTLGGLDDQHIVCAVSESRGISPTVGLAFVNLSTAEAILCQICDSQTYVRTTHKLAVYAPSRILIAATAASPESKLYSILEENVQLFGGKLELTDRRNWTESTGLEYLQQFSFVEDIGSIKLSIDGKYFAICCVAAVLNYIKTKLCITFPSHSLRFRYEPSEGSMMIDVTTIRALELIQNLHNHKSRQCLFGLLNETLTPMGTRLLKSNVIQPLIDREVLTVRYDALEELTLKEDMFFSVRHALKGFVDADKVLTALIIIPTHPSPRSTEQAINNILMLKQLVTSVRPTREALAGCQSLMLQNICKLCDSKSIETLLDCIDMTFNDDTMYARQPLELRNQRTYAVKSGVCGLLDVARQTYKEAVEDAYSHVTELSSTYNIPLELKFDNLRQFYIHVPHSEDEYDILPPIFTNVCRKKRARECQTLELMKKNLQISQAYQEVLLMSDEAVNNLLTSIRKEMAELFKVSESIALLDVLSSFAQLATTQDYVRPQLTDALALKAARHALLEKMHHTKFVPNDVYASQLSRFQIITGCNMSGKSTYIRSIALHAIIAQIGCFVPAQYATTPVFHQLFARISIDNSVEANMSTFAAEMQESSFILHNMNNRSLVIIDELGRGTSTRDGLAIALSIAETLVESKAFCWFATHFRELAAIMANRDGVVNLHLRVDFPQRDTMTMLYKVAEGCVQETSYGIALARTVHLPTSLVDRARDISQLILQRTRRQQNSSANAVYRKRRKIVLALAEHLSQARSGSMDNDNLATWLSVLQREMVTRMIAVDAEAGVAESLQSRSVESTTESQV